MRWWAERGRRRRGPGGLAAAAPVREEVDVRALRLGLGGRGDGLHDALAELHPRRLPPRVEPPDEAGHAGFVAELGPRRRAQRGAHRAVAGWHGGRRGETRVPVAHGLLRLGVQHVALLTRRYRYELEAVERGPPVEHAREDPAPVGQRHQRGEKVGGEHGQVGPARPHRAVGQDVLGLALLLLGLGLAVVQQLRVVEEAAAARRAQLGGLPGRYRLAVE